MKYLMLVSLTFLSSFSFATSIKGLDIRLQVIQRPFFEFHHAPHGNVTIVTVDSEGNVTGAKCTENLHRGHIEPRFTDCKLVKTFDSLSSSEQRRLERLIEKARHGKIRIPDSDSDKMHCLAMPLYSNEYTADNGSVFLASGTYPRGSVTYNETRAAKALVESLRDNLSTYLTKELE